MGTTGRDAVDGTLSEETGVYLVFDEWEQLLSGLHVASKNRNEGK
jgi:hypothetical protein